MPDGQDNVIISLTSYGIRLETVDLAIRSLMRQSIKPNKIILWLDKGVKESNLPKNLLDLQSFGLEIRYGCENIKGHKKYFWAMQEFPNSTIVTIDDDMIYPEDTLQTLISTGEKYPNTVVARRVNHICFKNASLQEYKNWEFECMDYVEPRKDLLATGVGGVLYPPHSILDSAFDIETLKKTALSADDIWLKIHEILHGVKQVWAPCSNPRPIELEGSKQVSLRSGNVDHGQNDQVISLLLKTTGLQARDLSDEQGL